MHRTGSVQSSADINTHGFYQMNQAQPSAPLISNGAFLFALGVSSYYFYASGIKDRLLCILIKKTVRSLIALFSVVLALLNTSGLSEEEQEVIHFFSIIPITVATFTMLEPYPNALRESEKIFLQNQTSLLASNSPCDMRQLRHERRRKLLESGEPLMKVLSENNGFSPPQVISGSTDVCVANAIASTSFSFDRAELVSSILLFFEILLFFPDATLFVFLLCPSLIKSRQDPFYPSNFSSDKPMKEGSSAYKKETLILDRIITPNLSRPMSHSSFSRGPASEEASFSRKYAPLPPQSQFTVQSSPQLSPRSKPSSRMQLLNGNFTEDFKNNSVSLNVGNESMKAIIELPNKANESHFPNATIKDFDVESTLAKIKNHEIRFRSMCNHFSANKSLGNDEMKFLYDFLILVANDSKVSNLNVTDHRVNSTDRPVNSIYRPTSSMHHLANATDRPVNATDHLAKAAYRPA
ncbi:hypothetical protein DI09_73p10, partial [Mitosporidium daphniae]